MNQTDPISPPASSQPDPKPNPKPRKPRKPSWSDIKDRLAQFDRAGMLGLIQDLYKTSPDNRAFLHSRFNIGDDPLAHYKTIIDRWMDPDIYRNQNVSVTRAKQAISECRKAIGPSPELADLMVFFCEAGTNYFRECGDDAYLDSVWTVFKEAYALVETLPEDDEQTDLIERLEDVRVKAMLP